MLEKIGQTFIGIRARPESQGDGTEESAGFDDYWETDADQTLAGMTAEDISFDVALPLPLTNVPLVEGIFDSVGSGLPDAEPLQHGSTLALTLHLPELHDAVPEGLDRLTDELVSVNNDDPGYVRDMLFEKTSHPPSKAKHATPAQGPMPLSAEPDTQRKNQIAHPGDLALPKDDRSPLLPNFVKSAVLDEFDSGSATAEIEQIQSVPILSPPAAAPPVDVPEHSKVLRKDTPMLAVPVEMQLDLSEGVGDLQKGGDLPVLPRVSRAESVWLTRQKIILPDFTGTNPMVEAPAILTAGFDLGNSETTEDQLSEKGLVLPQSLGVQTISATNSPDLRAAQILNSDGQALGVTKQLAQHIVSAKAGAVDVLLNPEELGRVKFEIHHKHDVALIVLSAERPETMEMLRRHSEQLLQEFRQSGFIGTTLSFGHWGQQNKPAQQRVTGLDRFGISQEAEPLTAVLPTSEPQLGQRGLHLRL